MLVGVMVGLPTAVVDPLYGYWINDRLDIPLRDSMGSSVEGLENVAKTPLDELSGLFESLLLILLVIVLVGVDTTVSTVYGDEAAAASVTGLFGNPSLALTVAALVAALTYFRLSAHTRSEFSEELTEALQNGGNIAAITAAGGTFGVML